jgi:hypothetical protein
MSGMALRAGSVRLLQVARDVMDIDMRVWS